MPFKVSGSSNYPLIRDGDIAYAEPIQNLPSKKLLGKFALFPYENSIFLHRIIKVKKEVIITKGDNNWFADSPIPHSEIIGICYKIITPDHLIIDLNKFHTVSKLLSFYSRANSLLNNLVRKTLKVKYPSPSINSFSSKINRLPFSIFFKFVSLCPHSHVTNK